jgi:hypothetical protein
MRSYAMPTYIKLARNPSPDQYNPEFEVIEVRNGLEHLPGDTMDRDAVERIFATCEVVIVKRRG